MKFYRSLGYKSFRKVSNSKSITSNRLLRYDGRCCRQYSWTSWSGEEDCQKFISEYGSMGSFTNTHKIKGKLREKVEAI